jgi:hypothetical protein
MASGLDRDSEAPNDLVTVLAQPNKTASIYTNTALDE